MSNPLPPAVADLGLPADPDKWTDAQLLEAAKVNSQLPWKGVAYAIDVVYATLMGWKQTENKHPSGSSAILLRLMATKPERTWFLELKSRVRHARETIFDGRGRPPGTSRTAA